MEQLLTGAEAVITYMEETDCPIALAEPRRLQQFGGIANSSSDLLTISTTPTSNDAHPARGPILPWEWVGET